MIPAWPSIFNLTPVLLPPSLVHKSTHRELIKAQKMKDILVQVWQLVHSWATARPVLFVMMNLMIGGILATSCRLRGKTTDAEDDSGQAGLFRRAMSRNFSGRNYNYNEDLGNDSSAPADSDHQETQYEDEDEEEYDSETREEEEEKGKSLRAEDQITPEIQEDVQQGSKYPPRNEKPSLSRRTRQSSRALPGEGSSGEMAALSSSSGEIAGAAASSTRKARLPPPPVPGGLKKSGSFLSSLVSFRRGSDRNIPPAPLTGLDKKKQGEIISDASTAEVDNEAEDFIQKFRRQLKLQRLESILQRQVGTNN